VYLYPSNPINYNSKMEKVKGNIYFPICGFHPYPSFCGQEFNSCLNREKSAFGFFTDELSVDVKL